MAPITEPRVDARITPIRVNFVPLTKKHLLVSKLPQRELEGKYFQRQLKE